MAVLTHPPRQALDELQHELGMATDDMVAALGVTSRTWERWRANQTYPQHEARRRLGDLSALAERLHATFGDAESVRGWMSAANRVLGGFSPVEALRVGRIDRVHAALDALDAGIFV